MFEIVLEDLKKTFGEKRILSPREIAPFINKSMNAQANMRSKPRKTFPIPTIKIGKNVYVSIYNLAEYLATGECKGQVKEEEAPEEPQNAPYATSSRKRKVRTDLRGLFDSPMGFASDMLSQWKDDLEFQSELFREIEVLQLSESIQDIEIDPTLRKRPFAPD